MDLKVFRVAELGPQAWQWSPPSIRVVTERKVRGCDCHGQGTLGTIQKQEGPMTIKHAIPCVCLRAIIDSENVAAVEDELNQHFMHNKAEGILCPCLFCATKRRLPVQNLLTSSS